MQRIYAIIYRHMVVWTKNMGRLTDSFFWPLISLFLWGYLSLYLQDKGGDQKLLAAFVGGYMFWMFLQRSQEEISIGLLEDLWNRNFINIFATPITIWEYIIALVLTGLIKLSIASVIMGVVAFLLFQFNILSFGLYLIPFTFSILCTGWWMGLLINGLIIRFGFDVEALGWTIIFLLQPFSGVFYPISILPSWMKSIAMIFPSSYAFEGLRTYIFQGTFDWKLFAISMILNGVFLGVGLLFYKKMYDSAKDGGHLVKLF